MSLHKLSHVTKLALAVGLAWISAGSLGARENESANDATVLPEVSDEITVTAHKREQALSNVGLAVTVISGEQLSEQGIEELAPLAAAIPNVNLYDVTGGGVPVVIIRGLGLQNFRVNNAPTAAFYVDDVYRPSVAMTGFDLFDLERLEVLKGPQGGIYGRNTTGGAIKVISRQPQLGQAGGDARLGYDEHGELAAEAAVTAPLGRIAALRIAARAGGGGGQYFTSVPGDFAHGATDRWAVRSMLKLAPGGSFDLSLKLHAGADRSETALPRTVPMWAPGPTLVPNLANGVLFNYGDVAPGGGICPALFAGRRDDAGCASVDGRIPAAEGLSGIHDSLSIERPRLDNAWYGVDLLASWNLAPGTTLTSITSYQSFDHGRYVDLDAVALSQLHLDYGSDIEQWSQELRLSGPVADRGSFLAGLTVARDEIREETFTTATSGLLPLAFGGLTRADQRYVQTTDASTLYGRIDLPLAPAWTIVGELRYTLEDKAFRGGVDLPEAGVPLVFADNDKTFGNFQGKIGLELRTAGGMLWWGSLSRGYKSGGFFGGLATDVAQLEPFDEETVLAVEVGFRSRLSEAVRLSGSLFGYDYRGFQANARETIAEGVAIARLTNVGDVAVAGAELELEWQASTALSLDLGLGYTDARIDDSDKTSTDAFSVADRRLAGARLPNAPELNANLVLSHQAEVSKQLFLRSQLAVSYRSEQNLSFIVWEPERALFEEDGYGLLDLRLTLGSRDAGWSLTAYASNLLDERYRTVGRGTSIGAAYEIFGPPRTFGTFVRYGWNRHP